jgi:hypothetical protein
MIVIDSTSARKYHRRDAKDAEKTTILCALRASAVKKYYCKYVTVFKN